MKDHPRISYIIQMPTPDLDNNEWREAKLYCRGVVHELHEISYNCHVPDEVMKMVKESFRVGHRRAEILIGATSYKFYNQPAPEEITKIKPEPTCEEVDHIINIKRAMNDENPIALAD
jgi:hypothetical protein